MRALLPKEYLEILRDRRTLFNTFVLPFLFYPAFLAFMGWVARKGTETYQKKTYAVGVVNLADSLVLSALRQENLVPRILDQVPGDSLPQAIKAFLVARSDTVLVYYDGADEVSRAVWRRVEHALERVRHQRLVSVLQEVGLDTSWLVPFQVKPVNLATEERMASSALAQILGYLMVLFLFVGGMNAALDTTAGEKERRTLEVLLALVPRRRDVVVAKVLAVSTVSFLTAPVMVLGMLLGMAQAGEAFLMAGKTFVIPWGTIGLMLLLSAPFAVFVASLEVALGSFARSFREAQTYVAPLMMVAVFPIVLASMPFLTFTGWQVLLPVYNIGACFNELLREGVVWSHYLGTFLSNLAYAGIMAGFTLYLFQREDIVFRQ